MALRRRAHQMTTMTETEENGTPPVLTASDRCDHGSCGAAALTRAVYTSGIDLVFCGHHTNLLRSGLIASGAVLHEEATV